jgi:hypothetical protein
MMSLNSDHHQVSTPAAEFNKLKEIAEDDEDDCMLQSDQPFSIHSSSENQAGSSSNSSSLDDSAPAGILELNASSSSSSSHSASNANYNFSTVSSYPVGFNNLYLPLLDLSHPTTSALRNQQLLPALCSSHSSSTGLQHARHHHQLRAPLAYGQQLMLPAAPKETTVDICDLELFLLTPKSIEGVKARIFQAADDGEYHDMTLERPLLKGLHLSSVRAWTFSTKLAISSQDLHMGYVSYQIQAEDIEVDDDDPYRESSIVSAKFARLFGGSETKYATITDDSYIRQALVQFEVAVPNGLISQGQLPLHMWLAVLTKMIEVADCENIQACFREYFYHRPSNHGSNMICIGTNARSAVWPLEILNQVMKWATKIGEELLDLKSNNYIEKQEQELLMASRPKLGILSLALMDLLWELQKRQGREDAIPQEHISDAYLHALMILCRFFGDQSGGPQIPIPMETAGMTFRRGVASLVKNVSPSSLVWIQHLDVLVQLDPTWEFFSEWKELRLMDNAKSSTELQRVHMHYIEGIKSLILCEALDGKALRIMALKRALEVAPTVFAFCEAAPILCTWVANVLDRQDVTFVDDIDEIKSVQKNALQVWFSKLLNQQLEEPKKRMSLPLLQKQFEAAMKVGSNDIEQSLKPILRRNITNLFLNILALEELVLQQHNDIGFLSSRMPKILILSSLTLLIKCPLTFNFPFLNNEIQLLTILATIPTLKLYEMGKTAMAELLHSTFLNPKTGECELVYGEVLRIWLHGAVSRGIQNLAAGADGSMPMVSHSPRQFLTLVQQINETGLHAKGASAEGFAILVVSMAQEYCCSLPHFFENDSTAFNNSDTLKLSASPLIQQQYEKVAISMMESELGCTSHDNDLDELCMNVLRSICCERSAGTFSIEDP